MDYRDAYRHYERTGAYDATGANYKHPIEDAFDRSRKRARSPSPAFDRYAAERRPSDYPPYSQPEAWDRERDYPAARPGYDDYRETDPYDRERERERALEWERYYRERDAAEYRDPYTAGDRDRYEARMRYDDEDRDRDYRRDRGYPYGSAQETPHRRDATGSYAKAADAPAPDPLQSETLLPFRSYAQMIKAGHPSARDRTIDPPTTQELYEGYQTYRLAFTKKAMWAFFEQRKEEAWFKEKYAVSDEYAQARQSRKRTGRQGKKQAWLEELESGKLDRIDFDIKPASATASSNGADARDSRAGSANGDRDRDRDRDSGEPEAYPRGSGKDSAGMVIISRYGEPEEVSSGDQVTIPASDTHILIKSFPPDISRDKLEQHLRTRDGFLYLALGEPHSGKKWHRVGWAAFKEGTDMEEAVKALDGKEIDNFTLHLSLSTRPAVGKLRTVPEYANSFARLTQDLKQVKQLVQQFEAEDRTVLFKTEAQDGSAPWLETNASEAILARHRQLDPDFNEEDLERGYDPTEDADKREERRAKIKKHLDWHLDLLRTAYNADYYLSLTCEFPEELIRRSPRHVRKQPAAGALVEEPRENTNDESWAKSVDQKTTLLLCDERADLTEYGGKSIDSELMSAALPYVKEEEKEKHRCIVEVNGAQCGKLFKAAIFVQKHVLNKHRAFLDGIAADATNEARFFNNYVRDPCRAQSPATQPGAAAAAAAAAAAGTPAGATPLASRFAGYEASPSPLFSSSRVGLIRLGATTADPSSASPYRQPMSLGMRIGGMAPSPVTKTAIEPLPEPPKPLDPRAARAAPKSYQDLDGPVAEGDVDDLAY